MSAPDVFNSRRLPARLTLGETARLLSFREHDMPVLIKAGLLKPLGKPAPNAPKYFATCEILQLSEDIGWLNKVTKVLSNNWRLRNQRINIVKGDKQDAA